MKVTIPAKLLNYTVSFVRTPRGPWAAFTEDPWAWGEGTTLDAAFRDLARQLPRRKPTPGVVVVRIAREPRVRTRLQRLLGKDEI